MIEKSALRAQMLRLRKDIADRQMKDAAIANRLMELAEFSAAKRILCYSAMGSEVNTAPIFEACKKRDVAIFPPESGITDFDLSITPLVAADIKNNRLGRGGGWYDKLFEFKKCIKIGLAYDEQIIDEIPVEAHDIPMDIIVTPTRTLKKSKTALF